MKMLLMKMIKIIFSLTKKCVNMSENQASIIDSSKFVAFVNLIALVTRATILATHKTNYMTKDFSVS